MLDFKRIGGEITSSPLNENFRKLRNDISIANMNLVFSETDGVKDTVHDMLAIQNPDNAQACYVVSSGELYRYAVHDDTWHKIADFGQTFRQGFLNSGVVVSEGEITLKADTTTVLSIPNMLVYYKNKVGDEKYLRGMYLIEGVDLDVSSFISSPNAYSIFVECDGKFSVITGLPKRDNPNEVFLGTFLTNDKGEIINDFIYTLPDIAYTADRGNFMVNGGQVTGLNLTYHEEGGNRVTRNGGAYYDEGINFAKGQTENFPVDVDNGSNYDLKTFAPVDTVEEFIYIYPVEPLYNEIITTDKLIYDTYWSAAEKKLVEVPNGCFTIQQHLITPTGQNIIIYGTEIYNSMDDAMSHINDTFGIEIDFPCVEATRIVIGNLPMEFSTKNKSACVFHTLTRLAQVGTMSPKFADNIFEIYRGGTSDLTPATVKFDLASLEESDFNSVYRLGILSDKAVRNLFGLEYSFGDGVNPTEEDTILEEDRSYTDNSIAGYLLADAKDLEYLAQRVLRIEHEIWDLEKDADNRYEQSVRYRLFDIEDRLDEHDNLFEEMGEYILALEENKVDKTTTINGYTLSTDITLYTDDIQELDDNATNKWFTDKRVTDSPAVVAATEHIETVSNSEVSAKNHEKVNPHNLSTDDLNILPDSERVFLNPDQLSRVSNLPEDTKTDIETLQTNKLDTIGVDLLHTAGGMDHLGDITNIRLKEAGIDVSVDADSKTLILECLGQADANIVMYKNKYATMETTKPNIFGEGVPFVDRAVIAQDAERVYGAETATSGQFYGINFYEDEKDKKIGWYDLPKYVTTEPKGEITIDEVILKPRVDSIESIHLDPELRNQINNNYHTILYKGTVLSDQVNTLHFGGSLDVSLDQEAPNILKINGTGEGGVGGASDFASLTDVSVTYTGNKGSMLVVNETEDGVSLAKVPPLTGYMLKAEYVSDTDALKIKKSEWADLADRANVATNADAVNDKIVNVNDNSSASLWTADKIISNTSSQIKNEGVNTYSGSTVPSDSLGKDGDLYILTE
jgi:hypothetical protein